MDDPKVSPDGKFLWDGREWVPISSDKSSRSASLLLQDSAVSGNITITQNNDVEAIARGVTSAVLSSITNQTKATEITTQLPNPAVTTLPIASSIENKLPKVSIISQSKKDIILLIEDVNTSRHLKIFRSNWFQGFNIIFGEQTQKVKLKRKNIMKIGGNPRYRWVFENIVCRHPQNDYSLEWWYDWQGWTIFSADFHSLKITYKGQLIFHKRF